MVVYNSPAGFQRWQGNPLNSELQSRYTIGSVLGIKLQGENLEGYVFACDKSWLTSDDLVLGDIVAQKLVADLDHFYLLKQMQQSAALDERIRLARDLHDGMLQSLTAVALQLETVHRLVESDPGTAKKRLLEIQGLIAVVQREAYYHIQELKPNALSSSDMEFDLPTRLEELIERIQHYWGLRVEVNLKHWETGIIRTLAREIYFIVHEALINAARHAKASDVRVEVEVKEKQMRIMVIDNGQGFPFQGRYDQVTLNEKKIGPATLKDRIASLGGRLTIDSSPGGAALEITLPLTRQRG